MDGLYWKSLLKWMIWGENPLFSETPHIFAQFSNLPSYTRRHMKISGETSPQLGPMASRCYGSRRGFPMGSSCGGDMVETVGFRWPGQIGLVGYKRSTQKI